jgi:quercetin dioxygenase-like cupin family protein
MNWKSDKNCHLGAASPAPFLKIAEGIDTLPLLLALHRQPWLWDQHPARRVAPGSPHAEMTDIWVRYGEAGGDDYSALAGPHDSVWYPAAHALPQVRPIVFGLMARVEGERLGGILITRLPPGGRIAPHTDSGWHAGYYEKFYVALQNPPGAVFAWEQGAIHARTGDCWWFRNDLPHWVENHSNVDRIAMIVCIRAAKFGELAA